MLRLRPNLTNQNGAEITVIIISSTSTISTIIIIITITILTPPPLRIGLHLVHLCRRTMTILVITKPRVLATVHGLGGFMLYQPFRADSGSSCCGAVPLLSIIETLDSCLAYSAWRAPRGRRPPAWPWLRTCWWFTASPAVDSWSFLPRRRSAEPLAVAPAASMTAPAAFPIRSVMKARGRLLRL